MWALVYSDWKVVDLEKLCRLQRRGDKLPQACGDWSSANSKQIILTVLGCPF